MSMYEHAECDQNEFGQQVYQAPEDEQRIDPCARHAQVMLEHYHRMEQSYHKAAVEMAGQVGVCRICRKPPTMPLILAYGNEYACLECLRKETDPYVLRALVGEQGSR